MRILLARGRPRTLAVLPAGLIFPAFGLLSCRLPVPACDPLRLAQECCNVLYNTVPITMPLEQPFSKRNRFGGGPKEITVREDAPQNLRYFVLQTALDLGWRPTALRSILCRVLRVPPDAGNWSEYPNIWGEVQELMYSCDWFKVYDIIEALHVRFTRNDEHNGEQDAVAFTNAVNELFIDEGIGWQLVDGKILTRGTDAFETVVTEATVALEVSQRPTAAEHLHGVLVIFVQKVTLSKFLILLGNHSVSRATSLICFDLLLFVAVFDHSGLNHLLPLQLISGMRLTSVRTSLRPSV